ncbi:hypothetical protein Aduo_000704 [Ancylostoma duodenale]
MRKELFAKLNREASTASHPVLTRLQMKLANEALNRWPVDTDLGDSWGVIKHSRVDFTELLPEHRGPLALHRSHYTFW